MKFADKITLCEVGLRDGLQNEKALLPLADKLALARSIIASGFPVIELGSFVSPKAVPQMADTDELYRALGNVPGVELRALIANRRGVDRAAACGCKKVKLNVSASRGHNLANLNKTPEESVAGFADCVKAALDAGIAVSGSISMPFGSPWERFTPVADVRTIVDAYLAVGVEEISLSDTSGMAVRQAFIPYFQIWCKRIRMLFGGSIPIIPAVRPWPISLPPWRQASRGWIVRSLALAVARSCPALQAMLRRKM